MREEGEQAGGPGLSSPTTLPPYHATTPLALLAQSSMQGSPCLTLASTGRGASFEEVSPALVGVVTWGSGDLGAIHPSSVGSTILILGGFI